MTDHQDQDLAKALLAQAFHVEPDSVAADVAIGGDERWDSLAHLRLMLALEDRLGRLLDPVEIEAVTSVADIARLLGAPTGP